MLRTSPTVYGILLSVYCLLGGLVRAQEVPSSMAVVISVAEQKLAILKDGGLIKKYPVSTSKYGVGDAFGSYKTPLGQLRICEKIGDDLTPGAVIKQRHATGEVLPVNAPGRDPIVTRILWLEGLESQNEHSRSRGIYIHGTPEETKIGKPASYGCIRMRSIDVLEIFDELPLGTPVAIITDKFPKFPKYTPPKPTPIIVVAPTPTPKPVAVVATPTPAKTVLAAPAPAKPVAMAATPTPSVTLAVAPSANKRLAHLPTPTPIAQDHRPLASTSPSTKTEGPTTGEGAMVAHAMKGSMLMAGLPEGPTIPTLPPPAEPKDVPRFNPLMSPQSSPSGLSLDGNHDNPAPAPKSTPEANSKDPSHIVFRANQADAKKP